MNVDLCAAFHAALHGVASPTRSRLDPDEERIFVQFPAEWLRNPQSPTCGVTRSTCRGMPRKLLDAMLALRNRDDLPRAGPARRANEG